MVKLLHNIMEKTGQRKTYKDPALNKIIQEKAAWNKQVSALINDLIHFKKSMNGWPSKYYKGRTRITQPVPVDLSGILGQIAGEFQEIANRGNGILQEQANFSKSHMKRKTEQTLGRLEKLRGPAEGPPAAPDLTQQLSKGLTASEESSPLVKLAEDFEAKYLLESQASNPFSRFITRLFTPKIGFGEGARVRRLRMTLLDSCVKAYKELKVLHREIVKSGKSSVENSHKIMNAVWSNWNVVHRLFSTFKVIKPGPVKEQGAPIEDMGLKQERDSEKKPAEKPTEKPSLSQQDQVTLDKAEELSKKVGDYRKFSPSIRTDSRTFYDLNSVVESIVTAPKDQIIKIMFESGFAEMYNKALAEVNADLGTNGTSFEQIATQSNSLGKKAQLTRELRKVRHQILPGASSGPRLEIYRLIDQVKKDLNAVMDLLEAGFDQEQLTQAINRVHRGMTTLRTMIGSLYISEKPEATSSTFFY